MKIEKLFDGWWVVESVGRYENMHNPRIIRQVVVGEELHIELTKGPFPTREYAETFEYIDWVEGYWESNMAVYADHCLGCGRWAKVLAFDHSWQWSWRVTECKKCGIRDSRVV